MIAAHFVMAPLVFVNEPSIVRVDDTTECLVTNDMICCVYLRPAKATDAGYFPYIFQTTNVFMDIESKRVFQV